jgi:hypothetical protein
MYRTERQCWLSPTLTWYNPFWLYLWRTVKNMVYHTKPPRLEMCREETEMLCATIPVDTLTTVVRTEVRWTQ